MMIKSLSCVLLALSLLLGSCASVSYYGQAVIGHVDLSLRKRSIQGLLEDAKTPLALKQRLRTVVAIRRFAIEELALPDSGSYTAYADLDREVTLWLMSAAPALSVQAKRWCYPFVGCLAYRGFFKKPAAEAAAARLRRKGFDVHLARGLAYSTLGWMDDPVLSTMLVYDDVQLAGVLFHEMAHELVFVPGDAMFNESFATTVAEEGQRRWLAARGLAPIDHQQRRARQQQVDCLLLSTRDRLDAVFSREELTPAAKQAAKTRLYDELVLGYQALRQEWPQDAGYDAMFRQRPNNAQLALVATYHWAVPGFVALLQQHQGRLEDFYAAVKELAEDSLASRRQWLLATPQPCADTKVTPVP